MKMLHAIPKSISVREESRGHFGLLLLRTLGRLPSLRVSRNPLVTLGLFAVALDLAYQVAKVILAGDLASFGYFVILVIGVAVVIAILTYWRRGLYTLFAWILSEDLVRKLLGIPQERMALIQNTVGNNGWLSASGAVERAMVRASWHIDTEATLCGCPVVASDTVGAACDLVAPASPEFVFPCRDVHALATRLQRTFADHSWLQSLRLAVRARMDTWSTRDNVAAALSSIERTYALRHRTSIPPLAQNAARRTGFSGSHPISE